MRFDKKDKKNTNILLNKTVQFISSCKLPTPWVTFQLYAFIDNCTQKEHLALVLGNISDGAPVSARIHSECLTGDVFFSQRCDCGAQLEAALKRIAEEKRGVLFYLRQEGRGIGLLNKVRAYHLQDHGADTVEANQELGFASDLRCYTICKPILNYLGIKSLRLMTNNPHKVKALQAVGIKVIERIPLIVNHNSFNVDYLRTKAFKLGHMLPIIDYE